jgi:hypothetical protein
MKINFLDIFKILAYFFICLLYIFRNRASVYWFKTAAGKTARRTRDDDLDNERDRNEIANAMLAATRSSPRFHIRADFQAPGRQECTKLDRARASVFKSRRKI